jgi:hypothetical protein
MKKLYITLIILFSFAALSGCVAGHHNDRGRGSVSAHVIIPLAPAHGYRHHHNHGVTLVFDAGLGVYAVVGHPGIYFHNGRYYNRHARGHWIYGSHFRGPWRNHVSDGKLPHKFRKHIKERRHKDSRSDVRKDRRDYRDDKRIDRKDYRDDKRRDRKDYGDDKRRDRKDYRDDKRRDSRSD